MAPEQPASSPAQPLVSVVCLTYNHERFVAEAISGLLAQTYPALEIVVLDDASEDRTAEIIARELARKPARSDVRFIRHDRNLGDHGRNNFLHGLSVSHGAFVVLSCGDDVMCPTMVEEMARAWMRDDLSLVTVNAVYIDEDSRPLQRHYHDPNVLFDDSFETLARNGANQTCFGAGMGFERSLYEEFGWLPIYLGAADIMMPFYAYLSKGARFIPTPLLKYRVHPKNTSLSLQAESSRGTARLMVEEEIFYKLLAHAMLMDEELERLAAADPARFSEIANRIRPLVGVQVMSVSRQLVRTRTELHHLGVTRLLAAEPVRRSPPLWSRLWPFRSAARTT